MAGIVGQSGIFADLVFDPIHFYDDGVATLHQAGGQIVARTRLRGEGWENAALNIGVGYERGELGIAIANIDGANDCGHEEPFGSGQIGVTIASPLARCHEPKLAFEGGKGKVLAKDWVT